MKSSELLKIVGTIACVGLFAQSAFAQDEATAEEAAPEPAAEESVEVAEAEEETPLISGFIATSLSFHKEDGKKGNVGFSFDEIEVDFDKSWDNVSIRADIEFFSDFSANDGVSYGYNIEQAFVSWAPSDKLSLTMGRFLVPIGWELIDPVDRLTYENANIFNLGVPFYGTGFLGAYQMTDMMDVQVYITSGLDTFYNIKNGPTNKSPINVGTRIGFAFSDDVGMGLSATWNDGDQAVFDIDFTAGGDGWVLGLEANGGTYIGRSDIWYAGLVEFNKSLTDDMSLTLRSDYFQDTASGDRLGLGPDEAVVSGTVAVPYYIAEAARLMLDYTAKFATQAGTMDNKIAFQAAYNF